MYPNTIHLVDISSFQRRDGFILTTGGAVPTCAVGVASTADNVAHCTEDVELREHLLESQLWLVRAFVWAVTNSCNNQERRDFSHKYHWL